MTEYRVVWEQRFVDPGDSDPHPFCEKYEVAVDEADAHLLLAYYTSKGYRHMWEALGGGLWVEVRNARVQRATWEDVE